jgi:hypothetical protein
MLANVLEDRAGRANNSSNNSTNNNSDSMQMSSHNSNSSIAPLIARLKEVRGLNMLNVCRNSTTFVLCSKYDFSLSQGVLCLNIIIIMLRERQAYVVI